MDLFKSLVWDNIVRALIARLIPGVASGFFGGIITSIIMIFTDKIYEALKLAANMELIALRSAENQKEFDSASVKLKIIALDKGIDSQEWKDAHAKEQTAFYNFVAFNAKPPL